MFKDAQIDHSNFLHINYAEIIKKKDLDAYC